MIGAHVVVELDGVDRAFSQEVEKVEVGVESELEGTVGAITGVAVVGHLEVGWEGLDAVRDTSGPMPYELLSPIGVEIRQTHMHG